MKLLYQLMHSCARDTYMRKIKPKIYISSRDFLLCATCAFPNRIREVSVLWTWEKNKNYQVLQSTLCQRIHKAHYQCHCLRSHAATYMYASIIWSSTVTVEVDSGVLAYIQWYDTDTLDKESNMFVVSTNCSSSCSPISNVKGIIGPFVTAHDDNRQKQIMDS